MRTIDLRLKLPVTTTRKDKHTVATCSALNIDSEGKNARSAVANLEETISSFLIHCLRALREKNDLERSRPVPRTKHHRPD